MHTEHQLLLNNGTSMPLLGLGVYKATGENEVEQAICQAVDKGYRLIDTATVYGNEKGVGRGIRQCGISRDELFVTTKVWNDCQRANDVQGAFERSLQRLSLDYVDLYLIHWPVPESFVNSWKELEKLALSGRARAIGVSNFDLTHLDRLYENSGIIPAVNQIEVHVYWNQRDLVEECQRRGIAVQAYAPLARGHYIADPLILSLSEKYQKTPAQIGLRYLVQQNISVIPKSSRPERILENSQIFDFALSSSDIMLLDGLDRKQRFANIPKDMIGQGVF